MKLQSYINSFLPKATSDNFTPSTLAAHVEAMGEKVIATKNDRGSTRVITESGLSVALNGYVHYEI